MFCDLLETINSLIEKHGISCVFSRVSWQELNKLKLSVGGIEHEKPQSFEKIVDLLVRSTTILHFFTAHLLDRSHGEYTQMTSASSGIEAAALYRREALRQVKLTLEIVQATLATPQLLSDADDGHGISRDLLETIKLAINNETAKLEKNEATIAVIGTVKSGKSTTINAIVGAEIVPSRDQPMTTFPTRVAHTPGLKIPLLTFPLAHEFSRLVKDLREIIAEHKADDAAAFASLLQSAPQSSDLKALTAQIESGDIDELPSTVSGFQEIQAFLFTINDLTRLASVMAYPLDNVTPANLTYHQTPTIEIEFQHLAETDGTFSGQLALIDTPGPDEAGKFEVLKPIVEQQLRDATAIILTVNYTQFGAGATEQLRGLLSNIPAAKTRLYALINHYDQRGTIPLSPDDAKASLAEQLGAQLGVPPSEFIERIFLTSARLALRANQARRSIRLEEPLKLQEKWVTDFANYAFGQAEDPNDESLADHALILRKAKALWNKSGFENPLEKAIALSARNAGRYAIISCTEKIEAHCAPLSNLFNVREASFTRSIEELSDLVRRLEADLAAISTCRKVCMDAIQSLAPKLAPLLHDQFANTMANARSYIEAYLSTGDPMVTSATPKLDSSFDIFNSFKWKDILPKFSHRNRQHTFSADAPDVKNVIQKGPKFYARKGEDGKREIVCYAEENAEKEAAALKTTIESAFAKALKSAIDKTNAVVNASCQDARDIVSQAFDIEWQRVEKEVTKALEVELIPPLARAENIPVYGASIDGDFMGTRIERSFEYRPKSGLVGKAQRVIGKILSPLCQSENWGTERVTISNTRYTVRVDDILEAFQSLAETASSQLEQFAQDAISELQRNANVYTRRIEDQVAGINAELLKERLGKEADKTERTQLKSVVRQLAAQARDLMKDALAIRAALAKEQ